MSYLSRPQYPTGSLKHTKFILVQGDNGYAGYKFPSGFDDYWTSGYGVTLPLGSSLPSYPRGLLFNGNVCQVTSFYVEGTGPAPQTQVAHSYNLAITSSTSYGGVGNRYGFWESITMARLAAPTTVYKIQGNAYSTGTSVSNNFTAGNRTMWRYNDPYPISGFTTTPPFGSYPAGTQWLITINWT